MPRWISYPRISNRMVKHNTTIAAMSRESRNLRSELVPKQRKSLKLIIVKDSEHVGPVELGFDLSQDRLIPYFTRQTRFDNHEPSHAANIDIARLKGGCLM